jgi:hypothetical protein
MVGTPRGGVRQGVHSTKAFYINEKSIELEDAAAARRPYQD